MTTNIYMIENTYFVPSQKYVGKTIVSLAERFEQHMNSSRSIEGSSKIKKSMREYGKINHKITLIEQVDDENDFIAEQKWIDYHNTIADGLNVKKEFVFYSPHYHNDENTAASNIENGRSWNTGISPTEETRMKISKTKKTRYDAGLYEKYGHKQSEETKKKMSDEKKAMYADGLVNINSHIYDVISANGEVLAENSTLKTIANKLNLTEAQSHALRVYETRHGAKLHKRLQLRVVCKGKYYA